MNKVIWLSAFVAALGCEHYELDRDGVLKNSCVEEIDGITYVKACPSGESCDVFSLPMICKPQLPRVVGGGSFCDQVNYLCMGTCENSTCVGVKKGDFCQNHFECDLGLACFQNTCQPQIPTSGTGCVDEFHCENSAFCDNSVCKPYFTQPAGGRATDCAEYLSFQCESAFCSGQKCLPEVQELVPLVTNCSAATACQYMSGNNLILANCKCMPSSSTTPECGAVPTSEYQRELRSKYRNWLTSGKNKGCNTVQRFVGVCMELEDKDLYDELRLYWFLQRSGFTLPEQDSLEIARIIYSWTAT